MEPNKVSYKVFDSYNKKEHEVVIGTDGYLYVDGFLTYKKVAQNEKITIFASTIYIDGNETDLCVTKNGIYDKYGNLEDSDENRYQKYLE